MRVSRLGCVEASSVLCLDTLSVQSEQNQSTRSVRAEVGGLVWGKFHAERARRRRRSAARSGRVDASGRAFPDQLSGSSPG